MRPASLFSMFLCVALLAGACTATESTTTTGAETTITSSTAATSTTLPPSTTTTTTIPDAIRAGFLRPVPAFSSDFPENPLLGDAPAYAGPATPTSLDGVLWADQIAGWGAEVTDRLAENGFVIVASGHTQFHEAYSGVEQSLRQPLFVTTDAAYHYWHLAFAKALRDTEQYVLLPILEQFASDFTAAAAAQADELSAAGDAAAAAQRVALFGELLQAVLDLVTSTDDAVAEELELIADHLEWTTSPVSGAMVDYTLFRPRGHYTRNEELTNYFYAMSLLGQSAFSVEEDGQLLTALLVGRLLSADDELEHLWRLIYEPTAFLVGLADDYTPLEAAAVAASLDAFDDPAVLADPETLAEIRAELLATRQVAIDPDLASVRVMGARFVLDSYILDQLVYPNVESRLMGSPLDVAAAFGSEWAFDQQEAAGETSDPDYQPQLAEMQALVSDRETDEWAGTVYDAWLYALQPSWVTHGTAYPDIMRTPAWAAKANQSGLGSYTELKHDTVLYAKQSFAEGEGPPPPPAEPRHWVEPEPVVFARLAAVAALMKQGLADRDLLADDVASVLDSLIEMYGRFQRLAADELAGRAISAEENAWLETISSRFELLWLLTTDAEKDEGVTDVGGFTEGPDGIAAVVVDIMSNPDSALEIATGLIDTIFVLVPNDQGQFQVARGGVYSYYEFTVPRGERMTDEEWRALVYDRERRDQMPERPVWIEPFLVDPWE